VLYAVLLFAHSWLRWIVLGGVLVLAVRALRARAADAPWSSRDDRAWSAIVGLAGLQMIAGLVLLLWASPIARAAWSAGIRAMLDEPVLLVFGVVHPLGMFTAVAALHGGWGRIRKLTRDAATARMRHAIALRSVVVFVAIAAATIPWPGLPWGRPLVRTHVTATTSSTTHARHVPAAYARCTSCHGESGRGDGPAAAGLVPRPRSFADAAWQAKATDAAIGNVIRRGGAAVGRSPLMPPHADLDDDEVRSLVAFIRACAAKSPEMP
jgi:cytochrome c553